METLPSYMKKNLVNMPNNKGYIHYGTHFYGLKPPENDPNIIVMFEKKGNILVIHKYYPDRVEISHKNQISKKTKLVSVEERLRLFI
jgi:hypothetical protein